MDRPPEPAKPRLPDFLLVGAAKSATSSLNRYLDQHPQISMASRKESWFFSFYNNPPSYSSPGKLSDVVSDLDTYASLFEAAEPNQLLGDASPSYLYTFEDTIRNIRRLYSDEALGKLKIIISLREPVSRAYSQYYTFKRKVREPLSFEQAVDAATIQTRLQDNWNIFYDYIGFGMYSNQVEAFQQAFGKDRVLVLLYEDINTDPQRVFCEIFTFLGVNPDVVIDDRLKHNSLVGEPTRPWIVSALFSKNRFKRMISALMPKFVRQLLIYIIIKPMLKRQAMDPDTNARLAENFRTDITRLEGLIDRDLGAWRS